MIQAIVVIALVIIISGFSWYSGNRGEEGIDISTANKPVAATSSSVEKSEEANTSKIVVPKTAVSRTNVLDISSQGLTAAPDDLFSKTNIESLNLSNNSLTGSLPGEIRFLQNLKVLNLSNNNFTGVPAEIGQLQKLEELDLSNNSITGLPNELGNLSNLKILNLKGNSYSATDLAGIQARLPKTVEVIVD